MEAILNLHQRTIQNEKRVKVSLDVSARGHLVIIHIDNLHGEKKPTTNLKVCMIDPKSSNY